MSKEQKKKRVNFYKKIIERKIDGKSIMFTDESKIDLSPFTRDSICLIKESQSILRKGEVDIYHLNKREERKFEKSVMLSDGVSFYGLGPLLILEGILNEFSYGQALFYFKEKIGLLNKKFNITLKFEQNDERAHTSKSNIALINKIFGKGNLIQNPPNSSDLAYPIEALWGILKPKIKRKIINL